ncbi:MAG: 4-(cytidine 5'-diphospho)-2-C-methyl-D-erythritol kinase [Burkholderiales bacterium]|nr:4-(cytidine 5'-diphospho)-2-C-methyl-D-erythritol kinase [Burkholderiales bacterium]
MIEELRRLPAPAKLNLFLHVTGRRADGYHLLETVFELIDLHDCIDLKLRRDTDVVLRTPLPGVAPQQDLTVRAARLLAEHTGCRLGVEITLAKRIPMGGGLGGGSSDAATVLLGLNRLWQTHLSRAELMALALRLGADVPLFVFGRRAYATGVGETLTELPDEPAWHVVVAPPVQVPTAAVFASPQLTRNTKPFKIDGLSQRYFVYRGKNDLEPVVCAAWPPVTEALAALKRSAEQAGVDASLARMTGSGACLFCPAPDETAAAAIRQRFDEQRAGSASIGSVHTVRSLQRHPLCEWAFAR